MARSALLNVMVQAATKAGRGLARDFGEVENLQVSLKGPGDFVSAADRKADRVLIEELSRARPGYGFLTEESGEIAGSDTTHRWIIDPLDGTTNYLHGVPLFAVSLALEREGEIVAGVVYNPIMNELYVAERGTGAYLNDRRLRVTSRRDPSASLFSAGLGKIGKEGRSRFFSEAAGPVADAAGLRITGSAATDLAWVASGRFDGYWQHGLSPWDMAAGILLVQEAGGLVSDANGRQNMFATSSIVAAGAPAHAKLLLMLAKARAAR